MTAERLLLNLTKPLSVSKLAQPVSRKAGLSPDDPSHFRAALMQESRKARTPAHGDEAKDALKSPEPDKAADAHDPASDRTEGQPGNAANQTDATVDKQKQPEQAQEAQGTGGGKDAPDEASSATDSPDAADAAGEKPEADGSKDAPAGPQASTNAAAGTGGAGAHGVLPDKPLTIRELNRVLRSLDEKLAPAGLLDDLGLDARARSVESPSDAARTPEAPTGDEDLLAAQSPRGPEAEPHQSPDASEGVAAASSAHETTVEAGDASRCGSKPQAHESELAAPAPALARFDTSAPQAPAAPNAHLSLPGIGDLRTGAHVGAAFKLSAAEAPAPGQDPARAEALQQQIARGMLAAVSSGEKGMTIRLNPDALGPLRIDVEMKGAQVQVRFAAATTEVLKRIDEALPSLRETLEKQGMSVGEVSSRLATEAKPAPGAAHAQNSGNSSPQQHPEQNPSSGTPGWNQGGSSGHSGSPHQQPTGRHFTGSDSGLGFGAGDVLPFDELPGQIRTLDLVNLKLDAVA